MLVTNFRLYFFAFGVCGYMPDSISGTCPAIYVHAAPTECIVYNKPGTRYYEMPGNEKSIKYIKDFPEIYRLHNTDDKKQDWIDLSWAPNQHSWVKRSDLLFYEDFKKVTDCFPIKYLHYETMTGEEYWLWPDGAGFRADIALYETLEEEASGKVQAYYTKNLYVFRPVPLTLSDEYLLDGFKKENHIKEINMKHYIETFNTGKRAEKLFYIDYVNKKVLPSGAPLPDPSEQILEVTWRTEEEMKHCKQVPMTEN